MRIGKCDPKDRVNSNLNLTRFDPVQTRYLPDNAEFYPAILQSFTHIKIKHKKMSIEPELASRQIQVQDKIFVPLKIFDRIPAEFCKMRVPSWSSLNLAMAILQTFNGICIS